MFCVAGAPGRARTFAGPRRRRPGPAHPLLTLIDLAGARHASPPAPLPPVVQQLYTVWLKRDFKGRLHYGHQAYDFSEGVLGFVAPGQNTQQHIHQALIERAKLLLSTSLTVNETAFRLGFEYPQYFSRLFKSKTGLTPAAYRFSAHWRPKNRVSFSYFPLPVLTIQGPGGRNFFLHGAGPWPTR